MRKGLVRRGLVVFVGVVLAGACGGSSEKHALVCDPGELRDCECDDGGYGRQSCAQDGSGWNECRCDGDSTGGSAGGQAASGGATGDETGGTGGSGIGGSGMGGSGTGGSGGATGDLDCSRVTDPGMYCDPGSTTPYAWQCDVLPSPGCVDEFSMYCCPDPCAPISLATHGWRCQNPSALQPWGCYEAYPGVSVPTGCEEANGTDVIICCPDGAMY